MSARTRPAACPRSIPERKLMMKNIPLPRKIYWWAATIALAIMWTGMYRRHRHHEKHNSRCDCLSQCLFCGLEAACGK